MLAKVLYNNDNPSTLTQEQKDTLSSIIRIGTTTAAVATTGEVSGAVNAGEVGRVGVENNDHYALRGTSYGDAGERNGRNSFDISDKEALLIKDLIGLVLPPIGFLDAYYKAKTDEEKALAVATAFKIPISSARMYAQRAKDQSGKTSTKIGRDPDNDLFSNVASRTNEAGTVYNNIKPTDKFVEGTSIPKSFELDTPLGSFWVHPNATKHMVENITRNGMNPKTQNIRSQTILTSFNSAVNKAVTNGVEYDKIMFIDGWELIFTKGRNGDRLPVIKHALYK